MITLFHVPRSQYKEEENTENCENNNGMIVENVDIGQRVQSLVFPAIYGIMKM